MPEINEGLNGSDPVAPKTTTATTSTTVTAPPPYTYEPEPEYHYYRAPYPILSFVAGLYCDRYWSRKEFEKWEASEVHEVVDGKEVESYKYKGFLKPYLSMSELARRIIAHDVPEDPRNIADSKGRRAPNGANSEDIWLDLLTELQHAPAGAPARQPQLTVEKPIISALAALYLSDDPHLFLSALELCPEGAVRKDFEDLKEVKGTPAAAEPLRRLKGAIFQDLIGPPNCW
jgi:hypothetical protein